MPDADDTPRREDEPTPEDLEVADADAGEIRGGLSPPSPPSGPVPIPYPNRR